MNLCHGDSSSSFQFSLKPQSVSKTFSPIQFPGYLRQPRFKCVSLTSLRMEEVTNLESFYTVAVCGVTWEWALGILTSTACGYWIETAKTAAERQKFLTVCTTVSPHSSRPASQRDILSLQLLNYIVTVFVDVFDSNSMRHTCLNNHRKEDI